MAARLVLDRTRIVGFRVRSAGLHARSPATPATLAAGAAPGLQDSMPRAAVLSLHARLTGVTPDAWADPAVVQVWGPRFQVYVVAADDRAVFTVARHPDAARGRDRAETYAARLRDHLGDRDGPYSELGAALGVDPNALRYATTTGTILIRWDGARRPRIRCVAPPGTSVDEARRELARRHLRHFAPATPATFARWAGVAAGAARATFAALEAELLPVRSPLGEGWVLAADESALRGGDDHPPDVDRPQVRLLPSGDAHYLLWGAARELLVGDADRRARLWTPRVWPGAVLVDERIRGTWRRADRVADVTLWDPRPTPGTRAAIEAEAATLPLPGDGSGVEVRWVE